PAKKEQEMAERLIDSLSTAFDPSAYRDEYREQLLALIERKAEGKEIVASDAETPQATKAPDLMAALEESIAAAQGKAGAKPKAKTARNQAKEKSSAKVKKAAAKKTPASAKKGARAKSKSK